MFRGHTLRDMKNRTTKPLVEFPDMSKWSKAAKAAERKRQKEYQLMDKANREAEQKSWIERYDHELTPSVIEECSEGRIAYCTKENLHKLKDVSGGVVFVPTGTRTPKRIKARKSKDPKGAFIDWIESWGLDCIKPPKITMGENVVMKSYPHIGGSGFGFHNGKRFPHIGGVVIGDRVEIGSYTCIDRGSIGDTVVGNDTKIDNLCHIAHNVRIGKGCIICAGAIIGGSAVIGDNVFIGIGALIRNKVTIGDGATIGMGAVVVKDVPAGATVRGNPAR